MWKNENEQEKKMANMEKYVSSLGV